jgi:hypothetical protein
MKEQETKHTFERQPLIPKVYEGETLPPEKVAAGAVQDREKINHIFIELRNIVSAIPTVSTNPTYVTYVTHVEAHEKDVWEQIREEMVDVAMFIAPPLICGAKYLYNRHQRHCLPEPRPSEQIGRTDAVQDPAYTERRMFEAVATEIGNRSVNAGAKNYPQEPDL